MMMNRYRLRLQQYGVKPVYSHLSFKGQRLALLKSLLIEPSPAVQGSENRSQATLLASLLLFGLFVLAINGLSHLLAGRDEVLVLVSLTIIPLLTSYILSRTRTTRSASCWRLALLSWGLSSV